MNIRALALTGLLAAGLTVAASAQQNVNLTAGPTDYTTWSLFGSATAQAPTR